MAMCASCAVQVLGSGAGYQGPLLSLLGGLVATGVATPKCGPFQPFFPVCSFVLRRLRGSNKWAKLAVVVADNSSLLHLGQTEPPAWRRPTRLPGSGEGTDQGWGADSGGVRCAPCLDGLLNCLCRSPWRAGSG